MSSSNTYKVETACNNCLSKGPHAIEKGTPVTNAICNNCGCKLAPPNESIFIPIYPVVTPNTWGQKYEVWC